ncbi:hypothetical protein IL306_008638 [Fusarium sp. DS 682]|nr:hypothetical protein IL306_008638 [Fusarium sp. DS 682]
MDPITAFQVAGTVITFVEFGRSLLTEAREVYKSPSGTTSKVVQLDRVANDLAAAGDQVSASLAKSAPGSSAASDQMLWRLCGQCTSIKNELQQALRNLQARGDSSFNYAISSVATAFKAMWSQHKINELDQRLQKVQSEMTITLLVSLWEKETVDGKSRKQYLEKIEASVNRTDHKLDKLMQNLVQASNSNNPQDFNQRSRLFRELCRPELEPDRAIVSDDENNAGRIQQDIIDSLWFPSIGSRDKSISEPYKSTYDWIFSQDSETKFIEWLRGTDNLLYWITGKAGSGKSTLMKHIVHHTSTMTHLGHWAGESPILFTYFYFWEANTESLQYSREGLLRTLLWQSLKARPELIPNVFPHRWAVYSAPQGQQRNALQWSVDELQGAFENLASLNNSSFKLVMFIDGLDEFDGDPEALVEWVKRALERFGIKICVGSRPWTAFSDGFERHPSLTMQYLTAPDIEAYINGHFNASLAFKQWQALNLEGTERLRQQFLLKADGVFLWVYLVVRDLMSALAKGKSLNELDAILDALPTDIMKLYTKIYEGLDPQDTISASRYFALRLASKAPLTTDILWSIEENSTDPPHDPKEPNPMDDIIKRRLDSSSRGMLELTVDGIQFHHRTATKVF